MAGAAGAPGNGPQSRAPLPNSVLNRSRVPCSRTGYVTLLRFVRVIRAMKNSLYVSISTVHFLLTFTAPYGFLFAPKNPYIIR